MKRPKTLSATFVRTVNVPGRYGDGRDGLGLSLLVRPASNGGFAKCWTQSVCIDGRPTSIGTGCPCPRVRSPCSTRRSGSWATTATSCSRRLPAHRPVRPPPQLMQQWDDHIASQD